MSTLLLACVIAGGVFVLLYPNRHVRIVGVCLIIAGSIALGLEVR